ncbi:MAG: S8 family serine peptidase [Firmicutes bacterium]|nr:S8 family serine peptidase [Bacillota bacterium]
MTNPIDKSGSPAYFSFDQLQRLADIIEQSPVKAPLPQKLPEDRLEAAESPGTTRDIILIPPKNRFVTKAGGIEPKASPEELKNIGVEVGESLDIINGYEGKASSEAISKLKEQGYQIYDNSSRKLVPGIPKVKLPDDSGIPNIDAVKMTQADQIHKEGYKGKNQVVAVIDSGFYYPGVKLEAWKDIVQGSPTPIDPNGHGTHVAGDVINMAPEAKVVAVRVMNEKGAGRPSDIVKGIQWAITNKEKYGIGVINLSLGSGPDGISYKDDPIDQSVEKAVKEGITVVDAAGNSGPKSKTIGDPADAPSGITVGSALDNKTVSTFSSRGPTDDGFTKPDIMAPGEFIVSWSSPGSQLDKIGTFVSKIAFGSGEELIALLKQKPQLIKALKLPKNILSMPPDKVAVLVKNVLPPIFKPDDKHLGAPGTSFASPEVAGIVADLRQAKPEAAPQEIKQALTATAEDMGAKYGKNEEGAGFIRADEALHKLVGQKARHTR